MDMLQSSLEMDAIKVTSWTQGVGGCDTVPSLSHCLPRHPHLLSFLSFLWAHSRLSSGFSNLSISKSFQARARRIEKAKTSFKICFFYLMAQFYHPGPIRSNETYGKCMIKCSNITLLQIVYGTCDVIASTNSTLCFNMIILWRG